MELQVGGARVGGASGEWSSGWVERSVGGALGGWGSGWVQLRVSGALGGWSSRWEWGHWVGGVPGGWGNVWVGLQVGGALGGWIVRWVELRVVGLRGDGALSEWSTGVATALVHTQGGGMLLVRAPDLFWPPPTVVSALVRKGRGLRWEETLVPLLPAGPVLHPFLCLQPCCAD